MTMIYTRSLERDVCWYHLVPHSYTFELQAELVSMCLQQHMVIVISSSQGFDEALELKRQHKLRMVAETIRWVYQLLLYSYFAYGPQGSREIRLVICCLYYLLSDKREKRMNDESDAGKLVKPFQAKGGEARSKETVLVRSKFTFFGR